MKLLFLLFLFACNSFNEIESYIQKVDVLCLMSVNPGFSGQNFIENTYNNNKKQYIVFAIFSNFLEILSKHIVNYVFFEI